MDPREQPLNEAARRVTIENDYDPNFSSLEERVVKETKLFLARLDALPNNTPIANGKQWQQRQTHDIVTELGRGVMDMDAIKGTRIVVYRDDQSERVRFATENHFHLMYEPVE